MARRPTGAPLGDVVYPYGKPVPHRCARKGCKEQFATYPGRLPDGWVKVNGKTYCYKHNP
jgi:hypothetical protein